MLAAFFSCWRKFHADSLAEFFPDERRQNLGQELRVLLVHHLENQKTVIRGAILTLGAPGEQRDLTAHGNDPRDPPNLRLALLG
jgi:hypothetical protein